MTAMGCPARDHDNDPMTADQASCVGYELLDDINATGNDWVPLGRTSASTQGAEFTGKLVGNGYRVLNAQQTGNGQRMAFASGIAATGSVEGLGFVNPRFGSSQREHAPIAVHLRGSIIGSYVEGGQIGWGRAGGMVTHVQTGSDHAGLIAHSYSRGITLGDASGHIHTGGFAWQFAAQNGTNRARCLNSFFSGTIRSIGTSFPQNHGLIATDVGTGTQLDNCYGDSNSSAPSARAWGDSNAAQNTANTRTRAQLQNPTGYTGAFANWDDYAIDGAALDAMAPRTDFWYFGDSTTFPVLKGWGHDRTEAMARAQSGAQTVNLCTRTLAVANEIIRLLKDDDRAPGITTTPAAVTALTDCTAASDTRNVSITNLTNLVVTSETNPFNLNPDRTDPASAKLTALDLNDFAYLTNATHFDLSGNSLTTLPPRLFQGVPLRWLDLSDNQLTTIPADLFAGLGTVTATTDNMLFLNGNSLTYTGIPGRVFDPLTHLNGLDLSDNSLTRVNTRWFEKLVNLGRRLATGAAFQDKLGLHLSGNTITEHYYSTKLFTGIRDNITSYIGTTAGDTLRTAIKNAIAAAAGGTTPTTLDIDSTEHFNNSATPPAYLGTADTCPANLDKGPAGHTYWRNLPPPQCYVSHKWSPPYVTGATTPAPTGFMLTGYPTLLGIEASYNVGADFIAVQMRYRTTPANTADPWTEEWKTSYIIGSNLGRNTFFTFASPVSTGTSYQLQLRALSRTAPPSTPLTATATTLTSPAAPQGLSASTSTTSARAIELAWTSSGWGTAQSKYQYRSKLSTAQTYGAWTDITGSDYEEYFTNSHTLTGLTAGAQYDIQLRLHWSDAIGASAASQAATATASGATVTGVLPTPRNFNAVRGTAPGTVDLSWDAVTGATGYQYRCIPACTTNDTWATAGTGTKHTVKFTLKGDTLHEYSSLYLRAITASTQSSVAAAYSEIQRQPGPEFSQVPVGGHLIGSIYIEWDPPSAGTVTRYEYAFTLETSLRSDATWYTVPDSDGDNDLSDETEYTITGLRPNTEYTVGIRVLTDAGYSRWGFGLSELSGTSSAVTVLQNVSANTSETVVGAIRVSWTTQTVSTHSEAKYQVRYKLSSSSWPATSPYGWTDVADGPDEGSHTYDESEVTVTGLMSGQRYDIELRFSPSNTGEVTPAAKVAANASRVPVPTDFNATPGSEIGEVDLSWNAITGATGYQYRCNPAGTGCTNTWTTAGTGTMHTVTGLTGGESYSLELRAITATEQSTAATATSAAQTLPGPQNFAAARGTNAGEIDLSWSAPSSGTVTHYEYRFKLASNASYPTSGSGAWAQVPDGTDSGTSLADETAYTIASLWAGVSYNIQLRVNTSTGNSLPFTATHTALEVWAPTGIGYATGDAPGEIDLVWTAIPSSGLPTHDSVVNYQYRTKLSSAGASTYTTWTNLAGGANTTSYTVTGLTTNTLYDVQLRAAIDDGNDQDSVADYHSSTLTFLSARSGIAIPESFTAAVGVDPGEVDLTWTAQTAFTASASTAKYQYRTKLTSASWPTGGGWTDIPSSNHRTNSYTVEGLRAGQRYDIELRFLATSSIISAAATAQVSLSASAVPAPQDVAAVTSATAARAIDVSWAAQFATTSREAKFQVRYKRTSASWPASSPYGWTDVTDGPDEGSYTHDEYEVTITGLTAGRDYDIELRFHWSDAVGASDAAKVVARASSADTRTPRAATPTGFDARTGSRQGEIDLYWNAVTGATGYEFRCSRAATGCPRSWSSAGTGTSHTVTGLVSGAFYNIELRALAAGRRASTPTASQRARAQSTTPVQPTARGPASLIFSHGPNPGDLKIDWTAPCCGAVVTHYEYRYKRETQSDSAYSAWQTVPDSGDSGNSKADEVTTTITGLRTSTGSFPARQDISYHVQFRVYASSSIGYSVPQRGTQTAKPVPPPPYVSCSESTRTPGEVTLEWNPPRGVNVHSYVINRRIGNLPWSNVTEATDDTRFVFRGFKRLRAGVRYTFRVSTVMTVGASAPSRSVSCVTPHIPPPSNLRVTTGIAPGELKVSWSPVRGATSYEYRAYRHVTNPVKGPWRDFSERRRGLVQTLRTSGKFEGLEEGKSYAFEVRAVIARVGTSGVASGAANARRPFIDRVRDAISRLFSVAPAPEAPGRIAIRIPRAADPNLFIYRHRTANPGQWSRWFTVTPEANQEQYLIPDLQVGVRYEVQVREYTGPETGFTTALSQEVEATPLEVPENFKVTESSGIIKLEWASPDLYTPDSYEYRSLPAGATTWGDWITVQHQGDRGTTQTLYVPDLESGVEYQFELRVVTAAGNGPVGTVRVTTRVSLPEINSIRPEVREVTLRAGDTIRLGVDVYNQQDGLDNSIPGRTSSLLVFRWSEQDSGGGSFADPGDGRRVVYTAPSSPGTYTITAEAQPDGICRTHHADASGISDANRAPCIATFTIRVTSAAGVSDPQPVPVNPAGVIPTELTDNAGTAYTVFTPVDGGMFTGGGFTVSAPAGAVPDRTVLGVTAAVSAVPVPAPVPGASMSVAGSFYDINGIQQSGQPPLTAYTLDDPLTVCLPFPDEFRADLSDVVVVQRQSDGNLSPLTTKVRTNAGILTICGAVSTLPATVGVAKLGTVPAIPATPAPTEDTPDTGGFAPGGIALLLTLLAGLAVLTGMRRILMIIRTTRG